MGVEKCHGHVDYCHPSMAGIKLCLGNAALWRKFHREGTEMIITKTGRRMFPSLRVQVSGLEPDSRYFVMLEAALSSGSRYKFGGGAGGEWTGVGAAEPQTPASTRIYLHPDSPASGSHWMNQDILFHRVKLTNNTLDTAGNLVLTSMHKYQPRIHIIKASDILALHWSPTVTFSFPETEFIAVTAYQNEKITKLKIDNNPFAKGFRENGQARTKRKMMESRCEDSQDSVKHLKRDGSICEEDEDVDVISCGSPPPSIEPSVSPLRLSVSPSITSPSAVPSQRSSPTHDRDPATPSRLNSPSHTSPVTALRNSLKGSPAVISSSSPPTFPGLSISPQLTSTSPPLSVQFLTGSPNQPCKEADLATSMFYPPGPWPYPMYLLPYPSPFLHHPLTHLSSPYLHPYPPPYFLDLKPQDYSIKLN